MNRVLKGILAPQESVYRLVSMLDSQLLWKRLAHLARAQGYQKLYLVVSFDCDTDQDAQAAAKLDPVLQNLGIKTAYAVPGELLLQNEREYSVLRDSGAEFINHGYRSHTYWDEKKSQYESCFFYNEIDEKTRREDIRRGHQTLNEFLGKAPIGFRTPHFGTFQKPHHLKWLHSYLKELGYKYSTSTGPFYSYRYGPTFNHYGLTEIPLSGLYSKPFEIFHAWGFFHGPIRYSPSDYISQSKKLGAFYSSEVAPGLINIYADPSAVVGKREFLEGVQALREVAESVHPTSLLC